MREVLVRQPVPGKPGQFEAVSAEIEQDVRNNIRAEPGQPYQQETVDQDLARLNRRGRYKQIESSVELLNDGTVRLIYTVTPQPVVKDVQSVGNKAISDQDIAKEIDFVIGTPVDRLQLDRACRRIEDLYRAKGFYLAQATVDSRVLDETGIVVFSIREGERIKVSDIRFQGNVSFTPKELRTVIKTKEAWLLERGPLDDEVLGLDVGRIISFYNDRGYLDVRADKLVQASPNGREAIVTFVIDEGPLYTLRSFKVYFPQYARKFATMAEAQSAAEPGENVLQLGQNDFLAYRYGAFTAEQLQGLMLIKPGDVYSQDKMRKSLESLRDAYAKLGYIFDDPERGPVPVIINTRELRDVTSPQIDLLLIVTEGRKYKTGEVIIQGNELTQQKVIRREVQVRPGRPLDATALDETAKRLRNTRLFETPSANNPTPVKVTVQDPDPVDPEYRDVLVNVTETNTGALSFGAAVGSDSGLIGSISLEQRNFDIFDTPDTTSEFISGRAFRGGGQTFKIEARPGTDFQSYSIGLVEPSLLDLDYSGDATIYYRTRDYNEFDEERYGTRFGIGRRFGTRWRGSIPFRIESISLSNIESDAPVDVFEVEDPHVITSIGLNLNRTTYDDPFRPGKGTRIDLGIDQVGAMGGDYFYNVLRAEYGVIGTVSEDFMGNKTTITLNTRTAWVPQGQDEVPVYERFYMGGTSFRGFRFRTIAPKGIREDNGQQGGDPVGGAWMFFAGTELKQPIFEETVSLVWFVDTGTVTEDIGFKDYRVSTGFGVRLFFPQLSPVPLAFDFGFPLIKADLDRERVFSFSVDIPFR